MLLFEYDLEKRKEVWEAIKTDLVFRKKYFEYDFYAFCIYYFGKNFKTGIKDFHKDIYKFLVGNNSGIIIGFRESGKTAICALFYIIWSICYKKNNFILFMAYDLESATDKVLNVSNFLRSDKKIKNDFGLLFDDGQNKKDDFNSQKRINKFVSTTGVKVEAVSLKNMKRGKQFLNEAGEIIRPDLLVADDIDIEESVKNIRIIEENEAKILSGVLKSLRGKSIFLGNIIAEDGVIQRLENIFKNNWFTKRISLIENGEIIWPERYTWSKKEAEEINKNKFGGEKIVQSIEELKIDEQSFNSDFLNIPKIIIGDSVFNLENLQKVEILKPCQIFKLKIEDRDFELEIYKKDFSKNYYDYLYVGVDVGGGAGAESDATSFCFLDKFGELYAKIDSNILNYSHAAKVLNILNNEFGFEFFENSLCIERNFLGVAMIEEIKKYYINIYKKLFVPKTEAKKITKYSNLVGWVTTQTSKEILKNDLSDAIDKQKIKLSQKEFKEFIAWTWADKNGKIVYEPNGISAKHDDTIISRGLALQMFLNYKF